MAESQDDKAVDACIAEMQSALDRLKASQRKDVADESGEDYGPKNLKGAERKAFTIVREHRRQLRSSGEQSGKPDAADNVK